MAARLPLPPTTSGATVRSFECAFSQAGYWTVLESVGSNGSGGGRGRALSDAAGGGAASNGSLAGGGGGGEVQLTRYRLGEIRLAVRVAVVEGGEGGASSGGGPPMAAAELHEEDAWGLQERSTAFYQQHNPERLEKVGW
jgi:hypothetical protein